MVTFVFTDESGARRRPVVVLSSGDYHRGRQEAIVAAITSNIDRLLVGDHLIGEWRAAGLLFPSVATGIIHTVKQSIVGRKLGSMSSRDMLAIEANLKLSLDLS